LRQRLSPTTFQQELGRIVDVIRQMSDDVDCRMTSTAVAARSHELGRAVWLRVGIS